MRDRAVAPWLQAALGGAVLIAAAELPIRLQRAAAVSRVLRDPTLAAAQAVNAADRRVLAIAIAEVVWLVVTGVLFMVWVGFAYGDLARSGARHRMPTAVAVIGPLVPLANLVIMPSAMDDLTRQGRLPRTQRVATWFSVYFIAAALRYAGLIALGDATLEEYRRSDRLFAAAAVPQIISAIVLIGLIGLVTERSRRRRDEAAEVAAAEEALDPAAFAGAMGWYRDPNRQAEVRWWDGIDWTEDVASSRHAPPPTVRMAPGPRRDAPPMPWQARLSLFAGFLSVLFITAPVVLGLGIWALVVLRGQEGAPGRGRAWFAVISGALFTVLLVLAFFAE